jgi:apolipoprotein D and lipocalin family protein
MIIHRSSILILLLAGGTLFQARLVRAAESGSPMRVVPSVDLARYAGKWYEIARLPNRFQRDCAADVTATYALRPDGKITVVNECRTSEGKQKSAKGTARLASEKGPNTKLKVSFFWPFSGNYWIIDLDADYRWAVVGEPDRKYLWILSRDPQLDEALYRRLVQRAQQQGYDVAPLIKTRQSQTASGR